jgi:hypothetical protein
MRGGDARLNRSELSRSGTAGAGITGVSCFSAVVAGDCSWAGLPHCVLGRSGVELPGGWDAGSAPDTAGKSLSPFSGMSADRRESGRSSCDFDFRCRDLLLLPLTRSLSFPIVYDQNALVQSSCESKELVRCGGTDNWDTWILTTEIAGHWPIRATPASQKGPYCAHFGDSYSSHGVP